MSLSPIVFLFIFRIFCHCLSIFLKNSLIVFLVIFLNHYHCLSLFAFYFFFRLGFCSWKEFYFFQTHFLNADAKLFVAEFPHMNSHSVLVTIQFNVIYLKNKIQNLLKINVDHFQRRLAELVLSQFPRVLYIPPIHC